ncbi:MAG TPA: hypothetical protein VHB20_15745 [Verrucomicrobiae bacterium]|jgi:hypothetical protein|nr:hypothetical protein [Verrucomicrobiae bacterium]
MIDQMELGFAARRRRQSQNRASQRQQRAQWWFARMRHVVDAAMEWAPEQPPRAEQVFMSLSPGRR